MEYLNGGDLYSLLRNLGCLDENVARTYIAEVVSSIILSNSLSNILTISIWPFIREIERIAGTCFGILAFSSCGAPRFETR